MLHYISECKGDDKYTQLWQFTMSLYLINSLCFLLRILF
jgi:hypothetical protein